MDIFIYEEPYKFYANYLISNSKYMLQALISIHHRFYPLWQQSIKLMNTCFLFVADNILTSWKTHEYNHLYSWGYDRQ
ncbi:MAG: hypothetical protein N5P05_003545 [Chroococcopsis gigantea SAG 12.99]|nr:hypothetical protein [Chroococcopsis gigantea SAG 12.99]